ESISKKFTMFNTFGLPVRATLSVTFRGYNDLKFLLAKNPFRSLGHEKVYIVKGGETLSQIAWNVFQDPKLWREIADFNKIENPRKLQPGQVLRIPPI
ncbi:MAG: LysM peptidoglycan-binding domain-containing protein, partial [Candidatus Thorarchaeota archaeon]